MTLLSRFPGCRPALLWMLTAAAVFIGSCPASADDAAARVVYDRDIRPILADNCYACHGPDAQQRKARLRLDTHEGAFAALRDGSFALVPGKPAESQLLERIASPKASRVMPPPATGKHLTPGQVLFLQRWVAQGATWTTHWAFRPPVRTALPKVRNKAWVRNPIDAFVLARLEQEGLAPLPEADRVTLLRRVTLDLTGLPPTPDEVDAFLADAAPDAYEAVVDRLLRSPRYGEHLARFWLDAARYGDTHGLHLDNYREIWPYRDWVIGAFNRNEPFDRFVIEQLAGDLLPQPSLDQIVATGFDRCNVSTSEGGSIDEEVYVRNTVDRVDTVGTVFLGLTVGCCRCHDHKFDPIAQKEYYQLFAFFNNIDGAPLDGNAAQHAPIVKVPAPEQRAALGRLDERTAILRKTFARELAQIHLRDCDTARAIARTWQRLGPLVGQAATLVKERGQIDQQVPSSLVYRERRDVKPAYLLKRGEYDQRGDQVERATPAFLSPWPEKAPRNRLGLAQWLMAPDHPLTARVAVNRFWQQCFGTGLVKTAEDFGAQGEPPSHPELLDWLAVEFRENGWDVKQLLKELVTSATYRQASRSTADRLAKDPANRLLSRGPRYRLDAEMLRDQSLAVSGLLVEHVGGPSVKPPQPRGLWEAVGYSSSNTAKFVADQGSAKVHRRSLYIFWKRTSPPPQMTTFDAPSREACVVRRERTNTPLQALLLMNGPQYVEAARALAERTIHQGGMAPASRVAYLFKRATGRTPGPAEVAELVAAYQDHRAAYSRDPEAAKKLIAVGESKADATLNPEELAAWTMVANLVLNLDEVITKG